LSLDAVSFVADKTLKRQDLILVLLDYLGSGSHTVEQIKAAARSLGRSDVKNWNVSQNLIGASPLCSRLPDGWRLTDHGIEYLKTKVYKVKSVSQKTATELRTLFSSITDLDVKAFIDEAISALELKLLRSAVILSWMAALFVLQREVFLNHLIAFNAELTRRTQKSKPIVTMDDFSYLKEYDFLQIIASISIIGKNVKQALEKALDLRNACGHPNGFRMSEYTVSAHIEVLILNVFSVFK